LPLAQLALFLLKSFPLFALCLNNLMAEFIELVAHADELLLNQIAFSVQSLLDLTQSNPYAHSSSPGMVSDPSE
jgi:hypothetical protein